MELPKLAGPGCGAAGSDAGDTQAGAAPPDQRQSGGGKTEIPTLDECLVKLNALTGLVALGVMKPAAANSMRASLQAIVNVHLRRHDQRDVAGGLPDDKLLDILRRCPEMLSVVEPLLTKAQLELIIKEVNHV